MKQFCNLLIRWKFQTFKAQCLLYYIQHNLPLKKLGIRPTNWIYTYCVILPLKGIVTPNGTHRVVCVIENLCFLWVTECNISKLLWCVVCFEEVLRVCSVPIFPYKAKMDTLCAHYASLWPSIKAGDLVIPVHIFDNLSQETVRKSVGHFLFVPTFTHIKQYISIYMQGLASTTHI